MMLESLIRELAQYADGRCTRQDLGRWLIANLQAVLDSGEQEAKELANEVDGLLVELGEGLVTEAEFIKRVDGLVRIKQTYEVALSESRSNVSNKVSAEKTLRSDWVISGMTTDLRLQHQFA